MSFNTVDFLIASSLASDGSIVVNGSAKFAKIL